MMSGILLLRLSTLCLLSRLLLFLALGLPPERRRRHQVRRVLLRRGPLRHRVRQAPHTQAQNRRLAHPMPQRLWRLITLCGRTGMQRKVVELPSILASTTGLLLRLVLMRLLLIWLLLTWVKRRLLGDCVIGVFRVNAIGARRFPSSIVMSMVRCLCLKKICLLCCRKTVFRMVRAIRSISMLDFTMV